MMITYQADSSLDVMSVTSGDQTPSHSRCQSSRSSHRGGHRRSIPPPNPWAFPMAPPPPFNGMQMPMQGMPFAPVSVIEVVLHICFN